MCSFQYGIRQRPRMREKLDILTFTELDHTYGDSL